MDQAPSQPLETISETEFPNGKATLGKVYVMDTSYKNEDDSPHRIIVMSEQSWGQFGTTMESMRQIMLSQDKRVRELIADVAARDIRVADTLSRLDALRDARRAEKRAEIEGDLITPGSGQFKLPYSSTRKS